MTASAETEQPQFEDHVGRTETATACVEAGPLKLMAALLDRTLDDVAPDGALPPLWHWCLFQEPVRQSATGTDGHTKRGDFMPPIDLPRRMFAGARTEWYRPLRLGEEITRTQEILSIVPKSGRSGKLAFVTVRQRIEGEDGPALTEEQDIVYREQGGPVPAPSGHVAVPADEWDRVETTPPDTVMLFRFSAATGNSHRIHYDLPYTRNEEGYPDLLIHGPLLAILLADLFRRDRSAPLSRFSFQAKRPAFLGTALHACLRDRDGTSELAILDDFGQTCMTAEAA